MSAYAEFAASFTSLEDLLVAIETTPCDRHPNGIARERLLLSEAGAHLYGYQRDARGEVANVIIPGSGNPAGNVVGGMSNDIGFRKNAEGKYVPVISDYDSESNGYGEAWLGKLTAAYTEAVVTRNAKAKGYNVVKKIVNGQVKLTCSVYR